MNDLNKLLGKTIKEIIVEDSIITIVFEDDTELEIIPWTDTKNNFSLYGIPKLDFTIR